MRKASETSPASPDEITTATFKVPRGLLARFRRVAESNERTMSQELRKVMADHIGESDEASEPTAEAAV